MVVPAGNPYMRSEKPEASGYDRIEMATLALDDLSDALQEKVVLTDLEVRREGPTYAIDTIAQLKLLRLLHLFLLWEFHLSVG